MGKLGQLEEGAMVAEVSAAPMSSEASSLIEQLYRTHVRELCRYIATRFGPGPPEPEEVAQVAFARLAAQPGIGRLENPRGYLYTIACNVVTDHRRRHGYRDADSQPGTLDESEGPSSELSPERVLLAQERLAHFEKALRAMPTMRRRILLLARAEGVPVAVIAERFGISENAVHKHISRGMQDCAAHMQRVAAGQGGEG